MSNRIFLLSCLLLFCSSYVKAQNSLNMRKIYQWQDSTIPPAVFIDNIYNEIWGWYDSTKNREYAIIGSSAGTHFFDITDTANIKQVDYVAGRATEVIHRDYKNKGHYLYAVADEFAESLMIIDMSYLPDSVSVVFDQDNFFNNSHNIWIDGDRMYACVPRFVGQQLINGLGIYDISNPELPRPIKTFESATHPWGNVHDLYVRNDTAYLNSEARGLFVVDFSDPLNHNILAQFNNYPFQGYNHSGWLSADGNKYVMADETHGMPLKYLDVSDLSNINIDTYLFPELSFPISDTFAIAHNPIIRDDYVFSSYYYDGVYVWDMVDPQRPVLAAYYDTYDEPNVGFYHGAWGVYPLLPSGLILVSDMQTGLYILESGLRGTDVEAEVQTSIAIYPNPVIDRLVITSTQALDDAQLSLVDMHGRVVAQEEVAHLARRYDWELAGSFASGFYVLKVEGKQGVFTKKVWVQGE